jgi:hypothetical protein
MGLDTKTYWLTDRQSHCDFDFDFRLVQSAVQCSVLKSPEEFLVKFRGSRATEKEMARRLHSDLKLLVSVLRSVARRRLVKTENPSACVMVNCKLCKSVMALC